MFLGRIILSVTLALAVGTASWSQHLPEQANNEAQPEALSPGQHRMQKLALEEALQKRLAEIKSQKKEIVLIKEAFEDARSSRNKTWVVTIPATLLSAVAVYAGAKVYQHGQALAKPDVIGNEVLWKLAGAGLVAGGTLAFGGSAYLFTVSQGQKKKWEVKLNKAEEELNKNQAELEKIQSNLSRM